MNTEAKFSPALVLDRSSEIAELIAESAADAIFMMDADGRITFANPAAERIFGWSRAELLGQILHDLLHHHHPNGAPYPRDLCPVAQAYRKGETLAGHEDVFFRKDGTPVPVSCSNAPIRSGGSVSGSVLTVQDITERRRAQTALGEQEAFLRGVLDSSPDCVKVIDLEGRVVFMNGPGLCLMEVDDVGCLINEAWGDLWPPEARARIEDAVARGRRGETTHFSAFCPTAKGTPKWWEVTVAPIAGPDGAVSNLLSVSRDVTERREREEALNAALARNADILESINDYYYALDRDWRIKAVNGKLLDLTGRKREEVLGTKLWDIFPNASPPEAYGEAPQRPGERVVTRTESFSAELGLWIESTICRDQHGTEIYFRDISDRKETEIALANSEAQFRTLAEALPQFVWSTRADGYCDYLNRQWTEYTGLPAEQHHGLGWQDVVHPDDRERTAAIWADFIAGRSRYDLEYRLRSKEGTYNWFRARAAIQRNERGEAIRIFGTSSDIREQKEAAERQHLMTRELHHRVKNTLATVQAVISATARRAKTPQEFYQAVSDRIVSLARTHTLLVNDAWGGATVGDLFRSELAPYGDEPGGRITLDGPPVLLSSELALALGMAAHELTTNAAKYGSLSLPDGRVEVRWSLLEGQENCLILHWTESDGPPVQPPTRQGFGSVLLERVLGRQLKGKVEVEYAPEGLRVHLEAPLAHQD